MADSDQEYANHGSEDEDVDMGVGARNTRSTARPKKTQAAWEGGVTREFDLTEAEDGSLGDVLGGIEEANKRRQYVLPASYLFNARFNC